MIRTILKTLIPYILQMLYVQKKKNQLSLKPRRSIKTMGQSHNIFLTMKEYYFTFLTQRKLNIRTSKGY